MTYTKLVPSCVGTFDRQSSHLQSHRQYINNSSVRKNSSSCKQTTFDGMSFVRQSFKKRKLSNEAITIIMASWRRSTQKQYSTFINRWIQFCDKRKIGRFQTSVDSVIEFLTEMFRDGYSYDSLNTARSALSSLCDMEEDYSIGSHQLVVKFMTGVYNLRPSQPKYTETFDVSKVLCYLKTLSPVKDISLKLLNYKSAMLIALTQASRSQSLSFISLKEMVKDSDSYTLYYSDLLKQSRRGRNNPILILRKYTSDARICVVTALEEYIERTKVLRGLETRLFISFIEPYKLVSSATISRWLKTVLYLSGIDVSKFKSHSIRGAAASKAKTSGLPIQDILKVAGWASARLFAELMRDL